MPTNSQRHYALAILTIAYVFNFVDRQLLAILLEPIKTEFGASDTAMGLLYGLAFSLFYATLAIPVARLADKGNRRNILAIAAALWSLMTAACGFAVNYWQLLLLRMGVAVGEAGGVPPSQSMVNDLYPPHQRARAMAVFSSATFIGTLVAMVGGAVLAQSFGWRTAFIVVGAPGIILAAIIRFTVIEPKRGAWDNTDQIQISNRDQTGFYKTLQMMWNISALRNLILGCGLASMGGYALGYFVPAFMIRVHGLSLIQAGVMIGAMGATIGLFGSFFGGWLCDRYAIKKRKWLLIIPSISLIVSLPIMIIFLMYPVESMSNLFGFDVPNAIFVYCAAGFVGSWWAAPTFVAVQEMVPPGERTLSCAILLFVMNLIGFGLGPLLTGVFSDLLTPQFGNEAVRYALMIVLMAYVPASYYYYRAAQHFKAFHLSVTN